MGVEDACLEECVTIPFVLDDIPTYLSRVTGWASPYGKQKWITPSQSRIYLRYNLFDIYNCLAEGIEHVYTNYYYYYFFFNIWPIFRCEFCSNLKMFKAII